MPLYETVFIARQDIPAQEAEELAGKFSDIVGNNGGIVGRREYWGLRNLAYRIKKNRKGHYNMLHIDAPAEAIAEMERNMRIDENILRYLTVRSDELDGGPSIMMQNRVPREDKHTKEPRGSAPTVSSAPVKAPSEEDAEGSAPTVSSAPVKAPSEEDAKGSAPTVSSAPVKAPSEEDAKGSGE